MHGGDIYRNTIEYDFSVNINPLGIPDKVRLAAIEGVSYIDKYPDIRCEKLKEAIGSYLGIDSKNILCSNGASELITVICNYVKSNNATLMAPCFLGYVNALKSSGKTITYVDSFDYMTCEVDNIANDDEYVDKIVATKPNIVFVANPNNPTGTILSIYFLQKLSKAAMENDFLLVIDECFIELTDKAYTHSFIKKCLEYNNVIILRAFTKSFAIPGIRLGYMIANEGLVKEISKRLPEWNVSIIAQLAGEVAVNCSSFLIESVKYITQQRQLLYDELKKIGMKVWKSEANYILFLYEKDLINNDNSLYKELLKRHILIRDCSNYDGLDKGYYRVAVKSKQENERLIENIEKVIKWRI